MPHGATRHVRLLVGAFALAGLVLTTALAPVPAEALRAADYPSWEDVAAAKRDEAQAQQLKARLEAQIGPLQDEAERTQAEAQAKADVYAIAQQKYDEQYVETQALLEQTAAAQEEADAAYAVAAQVISEMSKGSSGGDVTPLLFTTPGSPDVLLDRLEISRVLGERYAGLYSKALELRNRANALAEQAEVAQGILEELRIAAEQAFVEAQAAAEAAATRLAQIEKDIAEVRARVDYLVGISEQMVADYNEGLEIQYGPGASGQIVNGYTNPLPGGYITSHFGMRVNPVSGAYVLHTGTDLAGLGCGATIRATHAGTVTYAGYSASTGWGNYIAIDHGDGTGSGYAHIQNGGIGVSIGQTVAPGQPIAKVGSTGQSTGCHLHFIIRVNGNVTNPVGFMSGQGITLG